MARVAEILLVSDDGILRAQVLDWSRRLNVTCFAPLADDELLQVARDWTIRLVIVDPDRRTTTLPVLLQRFQELPHPPRVILPRPAPTSLVAFERLL